MAGIYIHIPFCKLACHYCNFHFSTSLAMKEKMITAIINEIKIAALADVNSSQKPIPVSTLYFGGGTPSILDTADLEMLFAELKNHFVFDDDIEITLEANPDDISLQKLKAWVSLGINRLSVGIQSFDEKELKWMNRAHTATESLACIDMIQESGIRNFSVDLIYGSPLLSDDAWKRNVEMVLQKNIAHISCYALTVEPKTALDKMIALGKKEPVSTEKQARHFLLLMDWMEKAGYEHYEISNFAKPGFRSRHNSSYWRGASYYGFGPSAHSFNGKQRKWNLANNALYIQSLENNIIPFEEETLTLVQQLNEYIMTSLRTSEGLDLDHVSNIFGAEKSQKISLAGNKYESAGKLKTINKKLVLTKEGKLYADGIAADLFF